MPRNGDGEIVIIEQFPIDKTPPNIPSSVDRIVLPLPNYTRSMALTANRHSCYIFLPQISRFYKVKPRSWPKLPERWGLWQPPDDLDLGVSYPATDPPLFVVPNVTLSTITAIWYTDQPREMLSELSAAGFLAENWFESGAPTLVVGSAHPWRGVFTLGNVAPAPLYKVFYENEHRP